MRTTGGFQGICLCSGVRLPDRPAGGGSCPQIREEAAPSPLLRTGACNSLSAARGLPTEVREREVINRSRLLVYKEINPRCVSYPLCFLVTEALRGCQRLSDAGPDNGHLLPSVYLTLRAIARLPGQVVWSVVCTRRS